jgi:hypothetical protein
MVLIVRGLRGCIVVGFAWGGWVTGGTAARMASDAANGAQARMASDPVTQVERLINLAADADDAGFPVASEHLIHLADQMLDRPAELRLRPNVITADSG